MELTVQSVGNMSLELALVNARKLLSRVDVGNLSIDQILKLNGRINEVANEYVPQLSKVIPDYAQMLCLINDYNLSSENFCPIAGRD